MSKVRRRVSGIIGDIGTVYDFYEEPINYTVKAKFGESSSLLSDEDFRLYYVNFIDYCEDSLEGIYWFQEVDGAIITELENKEMTLRELMVSGGITSTVYIEERGNEESKYYEYSLEEAIRLYKDCLPDGEYYIEG